MNGNTPVRALSRPYDSVEQSEDTSMDLLEIIAMLLDAKWWIILITLSAVLVAALYAFFAPPVYQANALVQIEGQNKDKHNSTTDMNNALGGRFTTNAPTEAEIKIMTSRSVLMPVVEKLHLNITARQECPPVIGCLLSHRATDDGNCPLVIGCLLARGDSTSATVTHFQAPDYQQPYKMKVGANQHYTLYSPNGDRVLTGTVGQPASSADGHTEIHVQTLAAQPGTLFALTKTSVPLAATGLKHRLDAAQLGKDTGIVQLTLDGAHPARVKQILNAVANQYLKQNVAAKSAQARHSLAFINKQLPALKAKLNAAETKLTDYRVKHGTVDIGQQTRSLLKHNVDLQGQLSQLKLRGAELAQKFSPKFPDYAALLRQKADVKDQLSTLDHQINLLPTQQQQYVRLKRDVNVYDALYTTLLSKAQDLRVAQAGTIGNVRIVDHAVLPTTPVEPKKKLDVAIGLMMGGMLGVLAAFVKKMLSVGIRDPDSLEPDFGVPLYAVIPHSKTQTTITRKTRSHQMPLLARAQESDMAVEAIRGLRTSLHIAMEGMETPVLTIGGASPGPGKSFISANLAHLIAQSNQRVLLVDADLRKGHLNDYFGISRTPGLSEILSGTAQLDDVVKADAQPGLSFVATGSLPSNPSELLLAPAFKDFITEASGKYDVILLDVPPYLAVSDGFIVARHAKVNFLLVHNGENTRDEIAHVVNRLQQNDVHLTGFIYNDFGRHGPGYAYRSHGARYQYRYE